MEALAFGLHDMRVELAYEARPSKVAVSASLLADGNGPWRASPKMIADWRCHTTPRPKCRAGGFVLETDRWVVVDERKHGDRVSGGCGEEVHRADR